jgi:hypothetical protein
MDGLVALTLTLEESLHAAVQRRAAKEGASPSAVVGAILQQALAAELDELRGLPPLADLIQTQHDEGRRLEGKPPSPF